jgi:hypothetical protein
LFGLEQLLHGHRLVEMVFGLGDLFTGDQEPHIGVHQVLRIPTSRHGVPPQGCKEACRRHVQVRTPRLSQLAWRRNSACILPTCSPFGSRILLP